MANYCRTEMTLKASPEAISWLKETYEAATSETLVEHFGKKAELYIDRVGSKWVQKYDDWEEDENSYYISLESAWYPPKDMIEQMYELLKEKSGDTTVTIEGRYWDEAFSPVGVFYVNESGWESEEEDINEDQSDWEEENPDGYFFDDVIDPVFARLKEELGQP
jgi:hypothetical protein